MEKHFGLRDTGAFIFYLHRVSPIDVVMFPAMTADTGLVDLPNGQGRFDQQL